MVLGAGGLLGRALARVDWSPGVVQPLGRTEGDVLDPDGLLRRLTLERPDWVINCAAFTAVDRCETEPLRAQALNGDAAGAVARICGELGARLLHLSTDYVFDGRRAEPWSEADPPNPLSVYGRTKLAGELAVTEALGDAALIARTQWLYGPGGPDFVEALRRAAEGRSRLAVVDDQRGTPTHVDTLAGLLQRLMRADATGIVHVSASGACSRAEWARAIFAALESPVDIENCGTDRYPRPAPRPANSVFDLSRFRALTHHTPPAWEDDLRRALRAPEQG